MRWLVLCLLFAASPAFAAVDGEAAHLVAARTWWDAAQRGEASAVDFRVSASLGNKDVCPTLGRGRSADKRLQTRLQACVRQIQKVELRSSVLEWETTKTPVTPSGPEMPVKPGEKVAAVRKLMSGIDLTLYVAVDGKGVVRRVWIAENYFE